MCDLGEICTLGKQNVEPMFNRSSQAISKTAAELAVCFQPVGEANSNKGQFKGHLQGQEACSFTRHLFSQGAAGTASVVMIGPMSHCCGSLEGWVMC